MDEWVVLYEAATEPGSSAGTATRQTLLDLANELLGQGIEVRFEPCRPDEEVPGAGEPGKSITLFVRSDDLDRARAILEAFISDQDESPPVVEMLEPDAEVLLLDEAPDGAMAGEDQFAVSAEPPQPEEYAVVRVLFATDRKQGAGIKPAEMFGGDRGTLTYGYCDVSMPRDHRMGELEAPSIWRLEFREDPTEHVVLLSAVIRTEDEFFLDVVDRAGATGKSSAFVFVHGYNVTFEDAARRTAQITYDLGFPGAPIFYSWPSQGATPAYTVDEQNVEWAQANLRVFLEELLERSGVEHLYFIAHSMGNRALTRALVSLLSDRADLRERVREVILTAPDIDAEVFKRDIVPALSGAGRPVTLYASSEDVALEASQLVHGYARAGDSGDGLVVVQGVDTIDAARVDTSFMGHGYFAENRSVLSDIFTLVRTGARPDMRSGLERVEAGAGTYWRFKR